MILLDTAPVVALCDPRDRLNRRAVQELDRLAREPFVLGPPVLTEACFLLPYRAQRERLRRFLGDGRSHPIEARTRRDSRSKSSIG